MGKKSKAPEYATASYNTGGLFGDSTTSGKNTSYNAPNWISNTMGTVGGNVNKTLSSMVNNDFMTDPNFLRYQQQFTNNMNDLYDTSVLSNLANRGLMRSSGLQGATNAFADTLANNQLALYDNYYNRQANNLSNLLNTSNALYNYITGVNTGSQNLANNVSNYNLQKAQMNDNSALWNSLANTAGSIAGATSDAVKAAAPAMIAASDKRVKKNIKKIGEKNGYNWYEFEYKDGYGLPKGKQEGVIAQEVEKVNPDAVTTINGIKHVYYSMLGVA